MPQASPFHDWRPKAAPAHAASTHSHSIVPGGFEVMS